MDIIRKNEKASRLRLKEIRKAINELSELINTYTDKQRFLQREERLITEGLQLKEEIDKRFLPKEENLEEEMPLDQVPKDDN